MKFIFSFVKQYFVGPRWKVLKTIARLTPTLNTLTVITPTLITPTIITSTLNTSTMADSLCNSGAFSNPNAVRDCPFTRSIGRG
jgi:hypothetical protein